MASVAATAFLALVGGLISLAVKMISQYVDDAPARKRQADAITQRDLTELESGMAAVDGVRPQPLSEGSPPRV